MYVSSIPGYVNVSASQSSSARTAPPLGHTPPPPPSKPPPYSVFSSSHYPHYPYGQYSGQYQQPVSTSISTDVQQTVEGNSEEILPQVVSPNKTVGETSEPTASIDDRLIGLSALKESMQDSALTSEDREEAEAEGRYKSNEGLKMKFSEGFSAKKRPSPAIAVQLKQQVLQM